MLITLQIGSHACPVVIIRHDCLLRPLEQAGEEHGVVIAACLFRRGGAHGILDQGVGQLDRVGDRGYLPSSTGRGLPGRDPLDQLAHALARFELACHLVAALQEPGDHPIVAPGAIEPNLRTCPFPLGRLSVALQPQEPFRRGHRLLQDGQTLGGAARHYRLVRPFPATERRARAPVCAPFSSGSGPGSRVWSLRPGGWQARAINRHPAPAVPWSASLILPQLER